MEEKKTFGEFVRENKGKIIAGALIAVGVAAGIFVVAKTIKSGAALDANGVEILDGLTDGLAEGVKALGEGA